MIIRRNLKSGFTIVELTLACAFLGVLLVTIALLANHIITIYQKGLSLKAVNSNGEDLIDEFLREIAASQSADLTGYCNYVPSSSLNNCTADHGYKLIYQQNYANATIVNSGNTVASAPTSGAFCTGRHSYVWNTGYALGGGVYTSPASALATVEVGTGSTKTKYEGFRLLRFEDTDRKICISGLKNGYNNQTNRFSTDNAAIEPVELLADSEDNLVLYDFTIFRPTYHTTTKHSFYSGTFILGTLRGGVNIMSAGNFCEERPDNLNTDFAYCAMNKFNFAMRATGEQIK